MFPRSMPDATSRRATRHRPARRQSETNSKWPAQPARRGGRSLSEFRRDPISPTKVAS